MEKLPAIYRLDQPARYEIQVQGQVSRHWQSYFDSLEVSVTGEDGWAVTTLSGLVADQAALHGVLQKLYSLGLVLLKLERKEN